MEMKLQKVVNSMLAMQRYPWEQGVCAQSLFEAGMDDLWIPMAYDAIKRISPDGRLAMVGGEVAVSDPAANGEVCFRAYEKTGDKFFLEGAERMLEYLLKKAPRTSDGIICHNTVSFTEGFSPFQLWVDGLYMVPPFLSVMGHLDEALEQIQGYYRHLYDNNSDLFYHIVDTKDGRFLRKVHWATGNGWALLGLSRVIEEAIKQNRTDIKDELMKYLNAVLCKMLSLQLPDGRFHDILDDDSSFIDCTSSMMVAAVIYRGYANGYISSGLEYADKAYGTVSDKTDRYGLLREVCGCPDFVGEGTSAEAQAAFIMASAWKHLLHDNKA